MPTRAPTFFLAITTTLLLMACAAPPAPTPMRPPSASVPAVTSATPDSDLVRMPGLGGNQSAAGRIGVKPMTFDELEACARSIKTLNDTSSSLDGLAFTIERRKQAIAREGANIDIDRPKIKPANRLEVDAFNQRVAQHNENIRTTNTGIAEYRTRMETHRTSNARFNTGCANRHYRQSDFARLPAALKSATEVVSRTSDIPLLDEEPSAQR